MTESNLDFAAFSDFNNASKAVLAHLHERLGFGLWMTTRTSEPHWIVLNTEDHSYGVEPGSVFNWADSFCSRMVIGNGPHIAPNSVEVPAYASAKIGTQVPIGAYIGVPIHTCDGSLFGTLCAIDPAPQLVDVESELPKLQLFARLLGTIASHEIAGLECERRLELLRQEADTDALTGLLNRKGWEMYVSREESRAKRYGSPICILVLDLDELKTVNDTLGHPEGDKLLKATAHCLKSSVRDTDIVARLGGDEFAVMAIECSSAASDALHENVNEMLVSHGIKVSIGKAIHDPKSTIAETIVAADKAMYEMKREHRTGCSR